MSKSSGSSRRKRKSDEPAEIVIEYDLLDLPTAFHKAGLAGLLLLLESLKERHQLDDASAHCQLMPTAARVTFTKPLLRVLMDDFYDAQIVELKVKSKWKGAPLLRTELVAEKKDGKYKAHKLFVYEQVQPKGTFFANVFDGDKVTWLKLSREMIWNIPRGRPTTRIPFNNRAEGKSSGEGESAWSGLIKVERARTKNGYHTERLSSALIPGAQAVNAEGIGFEGRTEQNLLLHFWPLVTLLYVPQSVDSNGATQFVPFSFSLAVPEVSDLAQFIADYPRLLHDLKPDVRGYRPAQAIIDIAAEGALSFLDQLATITASKLRESILRISVNSVEYLHLVKAGNNIKTMEAGRVAPNKALIQQYHELVSPSSGAPKYRHPLFRRGLLLGLLDDVPWHQPFGKLLSTYDAQLFIRQPRMPMEGERKGPPHFANDAATKLRDVTQLFSNTLGRMTSMPDAKIPAAPLAVIVNRIVRSYLFAKAAERAGVHLDTYQSNDEKIDWKTVPPEFNESKQKLALNLMLEFRSRKEQAFVDHFAGTFFSVTQRVSEADRLELAAALTDAAQSDDLKTLTLLSLSANS